MGDASDATALDDHRLAAALASGAGQLLLAVREAGLIEGKALGGAGDAVAQQWLKRALSAMRPDDAVLSEEAADDQSRLGAGRVWIIDPLDGTREFSEGRHDWAVHVALALDGSPGPAAVALPALGEVISTADVPTPETNALRQGERLRIAVSRTRPPAEAERLAQRLDAELVPMGSAGFKTMAVVRGQADAYVHAGGQYEWDSAAPVGVASAAGLHTSRIDGSPPIYNRPDPRLPDLLVCRPGLADRILAELAA
jgi:3'(2'), 5'-bisphosphate nucleotidase